VRQLVIDNPVINSAFLEPGKHFKFTDDGITDEIVESRRPSAYFIPVAQPPAAPTSPSSWPCAAWARRQSTTSRSYAASRTPRPEMCTSRALSNNRACT